MHVYIARADQRRLLEHGLFLLSLVIRPDGVQECFVKLLNDYAQSLNTDWSKPHMTRAGDEDGLDEAETGNVGGDGVAGMASRRIKNMGAAFERLLPLMEWDSEVGQLMHKYGCCVVSTCAVTCKRPGMDGWQ